VVRHDVVTGAPLPLNHLHFGPFAVRPGLQRSGVGRALLNAMLAEAQRHNCACVDIEVVNHRTDILPWYEAQGYVRVGTGSFPVPERCTRPCHFIYMRKSL